MAKKKLTKAQRHELRTLKADTFRNGFDMGFEMGYRQGLQAAPEYQCGVWHSGTPEASNGQTDGSEDFMLNKCVECGDIVPPYQNFLCEDCWKEAWNENIKKDTPKNLQQVI